MSFLLDTNILSALLKRPAGLAHRFVQHSGRLYTSSICLAGLYVWVHRRQDVPSALAAVQQMLHFEVSVLDFVTESAVDFGQQRVQLRAQGVEVNTVDLLIAAVALRYDLTLVTHNQADFQRIPDLRFQDWLDP